MSEITAQTNHILVDDSRNPIIVVDEDNYQVSGLGLQTDNYGYIIGDQGYYVEFELPLLSESKKINLYNHFGLEPDYTAYFAVRSIYQPVKVGDNLTPATIQSTSGSFTSYVIGDITFTAMRNMQAELSEDKVLCLYIGRRIGDNQRVPANTLLQYLPYQMSIVADLTRSVESSTVLRSAAYSHDLRINALPFRAYESIYNAYYRNTQNQPFLDENGEPVYNKYILNDGDGPDKFNYQLYQRNWELDPYTSALPSPQQGIAPLVGITALGNVTITDDDGVVTTASYELGENGETLTGKVSIHNPGDSAQNDISLTRAGLLAAGMSINDFRNVNALQHWLETNMRKGYKYRDFIAGHFGKEPEYRELDMPEFIGGFSQDVTVQQVTQTSASDDPSTPLGSYAGQAFAYGEDNHSITHYFDDYGYLIGVICVVPDPAYSQTMQPMFSYRTPLDYAFPEFAQIGLQPITYRALCPIQALLSTENKLDTTFGYQRPNWDMVQYQDEVHGQFRTTLSSMVISRVFADLPQLGDEFLKIDPRDVNQIFSYQSPESENIIGQVVFEIAAKRPFPRIHMPSLGR